MLLPHVIKGRPKAASGTSQSHLQGCHLQALPGLTLLCTWYGEIPAWFRDAWEAAVWVVGCGWPRGEDLVRGAAPQSQPRAEMSGMGVSCCCVWKKLPTDSSLAVGKVIPPLAIYHGLKHQGAHVCGCCFSTAGRAVGFQ